jgi:hypothetical protein
MIFKHKPTPVSNGGHDKGVEMKKEISVSAIRIAGVIDGFNAYKIIEKTSITGAYPRPIVRACFPIYTKTETLLYVAGNVGNYAQRILTELKENGFDARFIIDEEATEIETRQDFFA